MACPESTQFFQFDNKGNMYVYAPGAGCMGEAKLVTPGDELLFSNSTQWEQREGPLLSDLLSEELLSSTCHEVATGMPFNVLLPQSALTELSHKNFSAETLKKVRWVRKMYREWRSYRRSLGLEYISCDLEDRATISAHSLTFALCRFITEVKKVDGSEFPGKTLYDIIVCVQFHVECMGFAFKLINDEGFHDLKYTLDNTMKLCVATGV